MAKSKSGSEKEDKFDLELNAKITQSQIAKCPDCGSNLVYDPKKKGLYCEHCGYTEKINADTAVKELDLISGFSKAQTWNDETVVYRCDNCGSKFVLEKNETASVCPFCGTAHVIGTDEIPGIKPNVVVPFAIDIKTALSNAVQWAKKKFFAPLKFKKSFNGGKVKGVYYPAFTFDSQTVSVYRGRLGKQHTRVVGSGQNRRTETYVVWFNVNGTYNASFDDMTVMAGKRFNQKSYDKAKPFDTEKSCVYENKFLLGYSAYHYEKNIEECWKEAKNMMDAIIRKKILSQYVYDVVDYLNVSTTHSSMTYKYELLPVYTMGYPYGKKTYNVYINGSTGKVFGKTPVSPWKVLAVTLLGVAAEVAIGILAYKLVSG